MASTSITIHVGPIWERYQATWIAIGYDINKLKAPFNSLGILKRTYKNAFCIPFGRFPWRYISTCLRIANYINSYRPSLQKLANGIQLYSNPCWAYLGAISSDIGRDRV